MILTRGFSGLHIGEVKLYSEYSIPIIFGLNSIA